MPNRRRVKEHLDAGADHVALQVLTANPAALPLREWRELSALLDRIQSSERTGPTLQTRPFLALGGRYGAARAIKDRASTVASSSGSQGPDKGPSGCQYMHMAGTAPLVCS
jgi:hypothetical protein